MTFFIDPESAAVVDIKQGVVYIDIANAGAYFETSEFQYQYTPVGPVRTPDVRAPSTGNSMLDGFANDALDQASTAANDAINDALSNTAIKGNAYVTLADVQISFGLKFESGETEVIDFFMDLNRDNLDFDIDFDGISGPVVDTVKTLVLPIF